MGASWSLERRGEGQVDDERFMRLALEQALLARDAGEVPVGALVVSGGSIVGTGHNASLALSDPTGHAEVLALREAGRRLGNYRLPGATLYCTVEPCLMCLGAALHARVDRVVFGAPDTKNGGAARLEALRADGADFNHRLATTGGVLAHEASTLVLAFFRGRREAAAARDAQEREGHGEVPKWS